MKLEKSDMKFCQNDFLDTVDYIKTTAPFQLLYIAEFDTDPNHRKHILYKQQYPIELCKKHPIPRDIIVYLFDLLF